VLIGIHSPLGEKALTNNGSLQKTKVKHAKPLYATPETVEEPAGELIPGIIGAALQEMKVAV